MTAIAWSSALELGNSAIDNSHRKFLDALSKVQAASDAQFGVRLFALIERMERDFLEEDALMEKIGYADTRKHREQHARVLSALHHAVPAAIAGDYGPARAAVRLLPDWFLLHLSTMDRTLCMAAGAKARVGEPATSAQ